MLLKEDYTPSPRRPWVPGRVRAGGSPGPPPSCCLGHWCVLRTDFYLPILSGTLSVRAPKTQSRGMSFRRVCFSRDHGKRVSAGRVSSRDWAGQWDQQSQVFAWLSFQGEKGRPGPKVCGRQWRRWPGRRPWPPGGTAGVRANPADSQERSGSSFLLQVRPGLPGGLVVKSPPAGAGGARHEGSISGWGRSSAEGHGNPLQYSCLETPMDRGAWQATVRGIAKSQIGHCWAT